MKTINRLTRELFHHGAQGQHWGERNGPPYPLNAKGQLKKVHQLINELNTKWDYGVLVDGKRITDTSQMDWSKYRTLPIEKLAKEKDRSLLGFRELPTCCLQKEWLPG